MVELKAADVRLAAVNTRVVAEIRREQVSQDEAIGGVAAGDVGDVSVAVVHVPGAIARPAP
jgi:hypothetical protein